MHKQVELRIGNKITLHEKIIQGHSHQYDLCDCVLDIVFAYDAGVDCVCDYVGNGEPDIRWNKFIGRLILVAAKNSEWGQAFLIGGGIVMLIGAGICGPVLLMSGMG